MDPPQCVQNAMMTKDKKPFTYTPGGIDLSEVRSPRMQRRIEHNANLGSACDMPKPPQPAPQNLGPLPPSVLAAMRPQTQVQVFPGPPPPPPMQKNIPPPPPPPTCPLPTQKVTTGDNLVLERPDMTKIIPENPMALLRKTGGPSPRKSLVDQVYEEENLSPPSPPQRSFEAQSPRYQPPVVERPAQVSPPVQQHRQPQVYQQPPSQQYQAPSPPQNQYQPPQPQYQPVQPPQQQYQPPQQQYQPVQVQQRSTDSPKASTYQPPIIERQPAQKNVSSSVGSLYIPPLNQQQQKVVSPPTPPERNQPQVQSPGTPNLKEAPRPWQQKTVQQQQEIPPWAKKDEFESQSPPPAPNMQQRWQPQASPAQAPQAPPQQPSSQQFSSRSPQVQQSPRSPQAQNQSYPAANSSSFPVHIEIRTVPYQEEPEPSQRNPNAVYITQPVVLQHPGPLIEPPYKGQPKPQQQQQQQQQQQRQQQQHQQQYQQPMQQVKQQQPKVDSSGARIIPIQVEGRTPPSTPGGERNLSRQLSWGTQPPQSNSFKVIQKYTKTDDEEDDTPVTQHSARYPQEMPEQMRRMKVNDNGHFRQGNGQPQPYVHPSEQVVPEPKKYMGSNIPSRSFKILQAMTAPSESSANANYNEEIPYNPVFNPYNYPYYPPPYWSDYYTNYYPPQEQSEQPKSIDKSSTKSGRSTPLPSPYQQPYWHDYYPNNYPQQQSDSASKLSDRSSKSSTKSGGRSTPLPAAVPMPPPMPAPYWGYMPAPAAYGRTPKPEKTTLRPQTPKPNSEYQNPAIEEAYRYPTMYPPYFDPYYYSYYYGYPPLMPHYPYYQSSTENEDYSGYSSMDEMSNYNTSRRSSLKRRNSLENGSNSVQVLKQHFEVRSKSAAPRITITPTYSQENITNIPPDKAKEAIELEDSDTEIEDDKYDGGSGLRSIKSVQNINVYSNEEDTTETSESEHSSDEETDEEEIAVDQNGEEIIPHQLSVIYEESERGESRRSLRCSSVASESTTIAEHHSEEEEAAEEDLLATQNVKYKINLFQESNETGRTNIKMFEEDSISISKFSHKNSHSREVKQINPTNAYLVPNAPEHVCLQKKDKRAQEEIEHPTMQEPVKEAVEEKVKEQVVDKKAKETDEDWWGVIQTDDDTNSSRPDKDSSIIKGDNVTSKADTVMVNVGDELVCVKLRTKNGNKRNSAESRKEDEDSFFASVSQRDSVYDVLKNNEEEEEELVSGGTLMRVDSFASQLEAIKRNSGLWNLELGLVKHNNVIKEESFDSHDGTESDENYPTEHEENVKTLGECDEEISNNCNEGSDDIDFWSQIKNDEDDFAPRRRSYFLNEDDDEDAVETSTNNNLNEVNDSTNSSNSSSSESHNADAIKENECRNNREYYNLNRQDAEEENDDSEETSSESDSSEDEQEMKKLISEEQQRNRNSNSRSKSLEPQTIKDRIEALRNSIALKQSKLDKEEIAVSVKSKISAIEVPGESRSKTASTKSSIKSFEEYSEEEELDSGVISDISRHISDNEEFPELRKLTRYERAATHSRLFKLLQDECDIEEEEEDEVFLKKEDKFSKLSVRQERRENKLSQSRSKLSLPLNKFNEDDADEREPQINKKLVEELVQSLLKSKKAQVFRNMPKEKLYAAAVTILQEGIDSGETTSEEFSSLLSPLRGDTQSSTPAQTPQEFYADNEYKQYYDSWGDATMEIMPSKAFKLLQEHLGANKLGSLEGILAKCPRILSSKNIPREILKLLDESGGSDCSPTPSQNTSTHSNDVTNT